MEFNLRNETKSTLPEPSRPPSYFSPRVKLRLATLVAALGLVLLSMNEARKPATWERLGFASSTATTDSTAKSTTVTEPAIEAKGSELAIGSSANFVESDDSELELKQQRSDAGVAVDRFWNRLFVRIDKGQKQLLADQIVGMLADREVVADQSIADVLKNNLQQFHDENQNLSADATERLTTIVELFSTDMPDADGASNELELVQSLLDRHAYLLVEDQTSLNRSVESLAWNRSWQRVIAETEQAIFDGRVEPVSYLQLSGQSQTYRGQFVSVEGDVRGAETIPLPVDHKLGLTAYKVLWVKPVDSNRTPYCVYARRLPEGFPDPDSRFIQLNESVTINGVFFKLRSYEATNGQVETCPLIVADKIEWIKKSTATATPQKWEPPNWFLVMFMIGMPLIAGFMALRVYRTTRDLRRNYDLLNNEVESNLEQLSRSDEVKTDWERVQDFVDSTDGENAS